MSEERKGIGEGRVIDRPIHHRLRVINEGVDFSRPSHGIAIFTIFKI